MKTNRIVILLITLLFLLVAWSLFLSLRRPPTVMQETGNTETNKPVDIDRVINAQERARMEAYVKKLQSEKTVIKSFAGPSGETIDCVDIYSQPALKRAGMEKHEIQFAPSYLPEPPKPEGRAGEEKIQTPNHSEVISLVLSKQ